MRSSKRVFYYSFTTFESKDKRIYTNISQLSSDIKNIGKACKYKLNRHLKSYEKIIIKLSKFFIDKNCISYILLLKILLMDVRIRLTYPRLHAPKVFELH